MQTHHSPLIRKYVFPWSQLTRDERLLSSKRTPGLMVSARMCLSLGLPARISRSLPFLCAASLPGQQPFVPSPLYALPTGDHSKHDRKRVAARE